LNNLQTAIQDCDQHKLRELLIELVPGFKPQCEISDILYWWGQACKFSKIPELKGHVPNSRSRISEHVPLIGAGNKGTQHLII